MKTKKQLKEDYKSLKPEMGVFQVRNLANGKILVSNALNIQAKFNRYEAQLKFEMHRNAELQRDWSEQGADDFAFEVLSVLKYKDHEDVDYQAELDTLQEMVMEELGDKKEFY